MQKSLKLTLFALALPLALAAQTAQKDMSVGTWKLNVEKSKFSPGPAPKSETVTIQNDGAVNVEEVGADGQTMNWSYTGSDGATVPITGMKDSTVMTKRVSDRVIEHTWKMGNAHYTGRGVVSKDGKTMRYTLTGTNADGKAEHNVMLFEKQ